MSTVNQRNALLQTFDSLGMDTTGFVPEVGGIVQPTYVLDDLTTVLPNRGNTRVFLSFLPTAAAGVFSGIELVSPKGMWMRRLICSVNYVWLMSPFNGSALTITDPSTTGVTYALPEGYPDSTMFAAAAPTGVNIITQPAVPQFPALFSQANMGRYLVLASGGQVTGLGGVPATNADLWVPPGVALRAAVTAPNTAGFFFVDVDFPAVSLFAP